MHSSTVFALLATVAVSFALPGNYIPDSPPSPSPAPGPSPVYLPPTPITPPNPDPARNTPTPPAGPPNPAPAPPPPSASPTPLPPSPAPAPAPSSNNTCSIQQASACCVGDASPQNGGLVSILGAVAPCGLTLASQVCSSNVYCCDYHNEGQSSLINLQSCGPLVVL